MDPADANRHVLAQGLQFGSQDSGGQRVVAAIIGLARELEMDVVAEGIEEIEELRWLQSRGCQYGQGYFMAKPVPLGEALSYLTRSFEW